MQLDPSMERRLRASGVNVDDMLAGKPAVVPEAKMRAGRLKKKELVMRSLRNGDPFPFIRYEWPELIITDPDELAAFAKYCERKDNLDLRLDDFEVDIIRSSFDRMHTQLYVSGGTKLGKGMTVGGLVVNTWFELYEDSKIVLLGPDVEHVKNNLFAETAKWRRSMTSRLDGTSKAECLTEKMIYPGKNEHYVVIANPKTGEGLSGMHSPATLYVFDEACLDDQTEALTDQGWKFLKDFDGSEFVLTMNRETGVAFFEKPTHIHASHRKGKMILFQERSLDFCVTPDHRIPVGKRALKTGIITPCGFRPAKEMARANSNITSPCVFSFPGERQENYVLPAFESPYISEPEKPICMDDWAEFLGWFLSEGSFAKQDGKKYSVRISQQDPENREKIIQCCQRLGFNPKVCRVGQPATNVIINSRRLAEHLFEISGEGAINNRIPTFLFSLTKEQKQLFLSSFLAGDGYVHGKRKIYYTSSKAMADGIQILSMMCGNRVTVKSRGGVGVQSKIGDRTVTTKHECWVVSESEPSAIYWSSRDSQEIDYDGMVYCLTMPSHEIFMTRRNGICMWTGNSQHNDSRYTNALSQCASGLLIAISNPRQPSGWFYRAFKGHDHGSKTSMSDSGPRRLISVGLIDCLNVRANRVEGIMVPASGLIVDGVQLSGNTVIPEALRYKTKPLIPGQGCCVVVATLRSQCPANEIEWRVYGRFPQDSTAFDLFSPAWKALSQKRYEEVKDRMQCRAVGIDVAASTKGDYCAIAVGDVLGCKKLILINNPNVPMLKGEIYARCRMLGMDLRDGTIPVGIDPLNMGGPLADFMEMDGCYIIRCGATSAPERNKDSYFNRRAEMYGDLASEFDPQFTDKPWAFDWDAVDDDGICHGDLMWEELRALEKIYRPDGRKIQLNSKHKTDAARKKNNQDGRDSIEEKIGRSPDRADALSFLHEAIRELPDFFGETANQYDPSMCVRSFYEIDGMIQWDDYLGKTHKSPSEEFFTKFGQSPKILA